MRQTEEKEFQEAIFATHGCEAIHVDSVRVREVFRDETAWSGFVEVFDIAGHATAKRCYAWRYLDGTQWRYTTVLAMPPVDSPEAAVKVAVAKHAREQSQN